MKILVTGATGHFGSLVVESLIERGFGGQLAVSVREPARANKFQERGVVVRQGNFEDPAGSLKAG